MDNVGPLARRVKDAAIVFNAMQGYDPGDPYSADRPATPISLDDEPDIKGMRVGVIENWGMGRGLFDNEKVVAELVNKAVDHLVGLGAERVALDVPDIEQLGQIGITITLADAAAIHKENMEKDPESFGADVRGLLRLGSRVGPTDVANAHHARAPWRRRMMEVMKQVDCIVTPSTPSPAHPFQPFAASSVAHYTGAYNTLGYPALSVPCGFTDEGLPAGLMIAAAPFEEQKAITVAHAYETSSQWKERLPEAF